MTAEAEKTTLTAQVASLALAQEEAAAAALLAQDKAATLQTEVFESRALAENAEKQAAEIEIQNAQLAATLKEALEAQLAAEAAR